MPTGLKEKIPKNAPVTPASCAVSDLTKTTYLDAGPSCGAGGSYANSLQLGLTCVSKKTGQPVTGGGCISGPSEASGSTPASSPVYYMTGGVFSEQLDLSTTLATSSTDGSKGVINSTVNNQPYAFGCTPQCVKPSPPPASDNIWVANWQPAA